MEAAPESARGKLNHRLPVALAEADRRRVASRPGHAGPEAGAEKADRAIAPVPGLRVTRVEPTGGLWQISSSEIRERLARRESLAGLVPDKVIEYIREKGLYAGH